MEKLQHAVPQLRREHLRRIRFFRLGADGHRERRERTMAEPRHQYTTAIKTIDAHANDLPRQGA